MKPKFSNKINQSLNRSKHKLPAVFITEKEFDFGFSFLIDTGNKDNFIDPGYIEFYTLEDDKIEFPFPTDPNLFDGIFERTNTKRKVKFNGKTQELELIKIKFKYCDIEYNENFYIVDFADDYAIKKKAEYVGILGSHFFKKHKWVIDYCKQEIYSNGFYF